MDKENPRECGEDLPRAWGFFLSVVYVNSHSFKVYRTKCVDVAGGSCWLPDFYARNWIFG
ncbi:hypothetical protein RJD28_02805 [Oscillospiraceae bacterium NTUH-002-81]|nr:hypothetical protein RJD28_02805 [Oscillospiraceae bacterium NTUH-002-81]